MLFCGAPHILIPHAPLGHGEPMQDVAIAGTYFELLCASRGLGAVMLTFPLGALEQINQNYCLHCGLCFENCPVKAIVRRSV